ncbi:hypothetical protein SERLA73DRAFT_144617 [Serpula lacrymans var. lacrymans S7.3]|uniref:Uncharacterized protein n=2 Tax=Serpula lacrymans var. lacrymans TaxID=341189 RepID=F8QC39_SERL3|nr:uncharacterized protein SERLADRAFT_402072 [Serpula lacrymans var. lacrymans S7.9]EGN94158.1 hypothetical protein SERLA73DRAFT_144617 [Serpula lacrymans var. lacrymans S7.3]EGO19586.1 hypothetical protein SERLADRAFT_402072 [Serpula lacrymans var. lacrymans S7.9]
MGDPCSSSPSGPSSPSQSASTKSPSISKAPPKRRRRAPSPSQWIPTSLLPFKILPMEFIKSTSVPLPPVSAYKDETTDEWIEERDSWDESVGVTPYHPCAWKGKLPGPGLGFGGRDLSNLGLVGGSGFVMGRLVML